MYIKNMARKMLIDKYQQVAGFEILKGKV